VRLVSAGNCTIDTVIIRSVTAVSGILGGDGVYSAVGASIWGAQVELVSVVGIDYPREWLSLLRARGISTAGVRSLEAPHGLVAPMMYEDEERHDSEEDGLSPQQRLARWNEFSPRVEDCLDYLEETDAVHLASMPVHRQDEFLDFLPDRVSLISVDLPWWPEMFQPGELPRIDRASVVLLSAAEARGHFPGLSVVNVGKELLGRGAKIVAIKLGSRGSVVFTPGCEYGVDIPILPVATVDPTGAGDAYCGGFITGLHETSDPVAAARYGTVAASFVVEGFGADHALGEKRDEAQRRLRSLTSLPTGPGSGWP
jgi:sugar/nucleoside kinase (ribokinase family)